MFNVRSSPAGVANPRRMTVGRFNESPSQMTLRLTTARNCCEETKRSWRQFEDAVRNVASIADLEFCRIIPALVENVCSMNNVARGVRIDEYIIKIKSDGSIGYISDNGISENDIDSGEFIRNGEKLEKLFSLLDKDDVPGAAKEFLCHFYLKLVLSRLAGEKTRDAFKLHTMTHRSYNPGNNGMYPFLKSDGQPYGIKVIDSRSSKSETGKFYPCRDVKPFINSRLSCTQREKLYGQLEARLLRSNDLAANEQSLAGTHGVFAAQKIPSGKCIGVHGGTIFSFENLAARHGISIDEIIRIVNMDYLVEMSPGRHRREEFFLDGNNILSKINSHFDLDGNGRWMQARSGYNVEVATFACEMDDKRRVVLSAIFTTGDIKPGEEIRLNYHYAPGLVAQAMNTEKIVAGANMNDLVKSIQRLTVQDSDLTASSSNAHAAAVHEVTP